MRTVQLNFLKKISAYHFELYHFIILLVVVVVSQVTMPIISRRSTEELLNHTIDVYRWDTAERLAEITTSSLELLFQRAQSEAIAPGTFRKITIEAVDFILLQQSLQKSVKDICILIPSGDKVLTLENGDELYDLIVENTLNRNQSYSGEVNRNLVIQWFKSSQSELFRQESILSHEEAGFIHVLVPFSNKGEVIGAVYMKISPDLRDIESVASLSFDQSNTLFSILILIGLLAMFLMTNYLVRERDEALSSLYKQREKQLTYQIGQRKENLFTQRIYHAHHKAEKVVGFIKEDLRNLKTINLELIRDRVAKYANFIGRVIYDMKTFNPPVRVIRNAAFKTDLNQVIRFLVDNVFRRVYKDDGRSTFELNLDENIPLSEVNEYVVWEILEPLIQNCMDHNPNKDVVVKIYTSYIAPEKTIRIKIANNGVVIQPELLECNDNGVKKIFVEKITTSQNGKNSGYGCYIAYENCKRCGWEIDAINTPRGPEISITINLS